MLHYFDPTNALWGGQITEGLHLDDTQQGPLEKRLAYLKK